MKRFLETGTRLLRPSSRSMIILSFMISLSMVLVFFSLVLCLSGLSEVSEPDILVLGFISAYLLEGDVAEDQDCYREDESQQNGVDGDERVVAFDERRPERVAYLEQAENLGYF